MDPAHNDNTESVSQKLYTWVPTECRAGSDCANQGVPDAIRRATIKYNIPRWFYFAEAHRESTFNAASLTGPRNCVGDSTTGFGLMQLTNPDHMGFLYPENLRAPDQSNSAWQTNMRIPYYCTQYGLCPWINMNDVTSLGCDAWNDPFANLDRYSSGYAAPMYYLLKKKNPAGTSSDDLLRQVAYYWRYGLFGPYNYPTDPYHYLSGAAPYDYDTYVAAYKTSVNNDDYNGGSWNGNVCTPPYSSQGCSSGSGTSPSSTLPTYSSTLSVNPTCLVAGSGSSSMKATFTNTNDVAYNGMLDIEVWDGTTKVDQSSQAQSTAANGTNSLTWNWAAPTSVAQPKKDYTIKFGVFSPDGATSLNWNANAGTISVSADKSQYNFECSNTQNWTFLAASPVTAVAPSANQAQFGTNSLAVVFSGTAVGVGDAMTLSGPLPTVGGTVVTFHVWVPSGSALTAVAPFVKQGAAGNWAWTDTWTAIAQLTANAWNTLTVTVPRNAVFPLDSMGVEFVTSRAYSGTAYIDAVTW
ncbi:MAG: hypothetical protein FWD73_04550 [Polyangiaceae bacterium]|nr:hypothetical protein [Polyangiaceae bacterium]